MEEGRNLRDESDFLLFNTVVVLIRVARIGIATIAAVVAVGGSALQVCSWPYRKSYRYPTRERHRRSRPCLSTRGAAPLIENPFTHGEIGVLMCKGQDDLLVLVNAVIAQMKADGTLRQLHEKYGLVYGYE